MQPQTQDFYTFADFHLDRAEKTLWREGKPVALTPKVFDTLLVFVENAGRLLEKDELMREIWRDSFVEESNLTFNVKTLRRALGDDAQNPRFIETVPRRGYRFIAEVLRETAENSFNGSGKYNPNFASSLAINDSVAAVPDETVAKDDWQDELETVENSAPLLAKTNGNLNGNSHVPTANFSDSPSKNKSFASAYLAIGLILILIAAAGGSYGLYRWFNAPKAAAIQPVISKSDIKRLTSSGNIHSAAISPDGKFVAYITDDNGNPNFYLKSLHTGGQVQLPLATEIKLVNNITFAPDGNSLFYGANGALYQTSVLGGTPKKVLAKYPRMPHNKISFSPDGKQFAFLTIQSTDKGEISQLIAADAQTGAERVVAESKSPTVFLRSAAWSPDGQTIVCAALVPTGNQEILAVDVKDGTVLSVPSSRVWDFVGEIVWKPDGSGLLAIAAESDSSLLMSQIWSISYPLGVTNKITDDANNYRSLSLTGDGNSIVAVRAEQQAYIWVASADANASQPRQLTDGFEKFDGIWGIDWSNNGRIIYEAAPSDKPEIWQIDAEGHNSEQLASEAGATGASPDGKYVVFQSGDKGQMGLFRLDWKNNEKIRLTTGTDLDPAFSPDGSWIVFTRYAEDVALWRVSSSGGEAVKLTNLPGQATSPSVSPDGKHIAFFHSTNATNKPPSYAIITSEGGGIVKEFNAFGWRFKGSGKWAVQWAADGQCLIYANNKEGVSNLWQQPLDGKPPVQITNFESGQIFNFAAAPDGKQFALSRGTFSRDAVSISNLK